MEEIRTESLPPPPGVINSIKAGFEAIASHVAAILLPLVLDLFLWLGPRLSMEKLYLSMLPQIIEAWRLFGVSAEQIQKMIDRNAEVLPQVNLFLFLRTLPIGITSLIFSRTNPIGIMSLIMPGDGSGSPLGAPSVMQVSSDGNLLGWIFLLTLLGWIGGAIYFSLVARLARINGQSELLLTGRVIGQTILISVFGTWIVLIIGIPVFLVLLWLLQLNLVIGQFAMFFLSFLSMWFIVPFFFWPHGVFLYKQNAFMSIFTSVRLARFTLPTSSMFVLTILLLSIGLNFLWVIPPQDSWMTLVGILGHAFVTTALLAASFIYYRDMNIWLQTVMERLKANVTAKQA